MTKLFPFLEPYLELFYVKDYFDTSNQKTPAEFCGTFMVLEVSGNRLGYEKITVTLDRLLSVFCSMEYMKNLSSKGESIICRVYVAFTIIHNVIVEMARLSRMIQLPISNVHKNILVLTNIQKCLGVLHKELLNCNQDDEDVYISVDDLYQLIRMKLKEIIKSLTINHSVDTLVKLFTEEDRERAYDLVKFAFANEDETICVTDAHLSIEVTNCQSWVAMWLKVRRARTRDDLLQLAPVHLCAVCQQVDLEKADNFVFFDICGHIYCVQCSSVLLGGAGSKCCPYCRRNIGAWMTLETFTKHRIAMDARCTSAEEQATSALEGLIDAVKAASSRLLSVISYGYLK